MSNDLLDCVAAIVEENSLVCGELVNTNFTLVVYDNISEFIYSPSSRACYARMQHVCLHFSVRKPHHVFILLVFIDPTIIYWIQLCQITQIYQIYNQHHVIMGWEPDNSYIMVNQFDMKQPIDQCQQIRMEMGPNYSSVN